MLELFDCVLICDPWRTIAMRFLWQCLRLFIRVHLRHLRTVVYFYRISLAS